MFQRSVPTLLSLAVDMKQSPDGGRKTLDTGSQPPVIVTPPYAPYLKPNAFTHFCRYSVESFTNLYLNCNWASNNNANVAMNPSYNERYDTTRRPPRRDTTQTEQDVWKVHDAFVTGKSAVSQWPVLVPRPTSIIFSRGGAKNMEAREQQWPEVREIPCATS